MNFQLKNRFERTLRAAKNSSRKTRTFTFTIPQAAKRTTPRPTALPTERKKSGLTTIVVCAIPDDSSRHMNVRPNIGHAEMDVLRFVAEHHPVTVRDVADHVAETKGHTRTTAL